MNINIYTGFSKKKNSTKVPTGTGTAVTASLKRQTSYHNPVFVLSPVTGVTMEDISYIKYGSHYYFVTDITVVPNNVYEISCAEDPMATHRSEILGSTQYVLYSASKFYPFIPDPRVPQQSEVISKPHDFSIVPFTESGGYYVVSCISERTGGRGEEFVTNYMVDSMNLSGLVDMLIDTAWAPSLINTMGKPFDCISSIRYIPISDSTVRTDLSMSSLSDIILGTENMNPAQGYIFPTSSNIVSKSETLTIGWHYSADWRISSPYTTGDLFIPGYGLVEINPLQCAYSITVEFNYDAVTGDVTVYILGRNEALDPDTLIATINYNVAVQIPLAQLGSNPSGMITSVGVAAGAALGLSLGMGGLAAAGALAGGVGNAIIAANTRTPSAKGSITGRSWLAPPLMCLVERYINTIDVDSMKTTEGMPLMEETTLSTLSGYCKCENASVSIAGYDSDRDYINNVLNSGFFIE